MTLNDTLSAAMDRGLSYLADRQMPDGNFPTWVATDDALLQNPVPDPSLSLTHYLVASLIQVPNKKTGPLIAKAKRFFMSEKWRGGLWRFWTKSHPGVSYMPPNTDDTVCVARLLQSPDLHFEQMKAIVLNNRNQAGIFYNWILPRAAHVTTPTAWMPLAALSKNPFKLSKYFRLGAAKPHPEHVDLVPNVNAVLFFGELAETAPAIRWVLQAVKEGNEVASDRSYQSRYSTFYTILRCAQAGITAFEPVQELILNRLKSEIKSQGQCGKSVLETALAANVLGYWAPESEEFQSAIAFILKHQQPNGSWPIWVFYYGGWSPHTLRWGSAELVTAFCVEALARALKSQSTGNPLQDGLTDR